MNVNDLKLGDIINYLTDILGASAQKGKIIGYTQSKLQLISPGTMEQHSVPWWIRKEQVVSKLEPLPQEIKYKEIPIEKEVTHNQLIPETHYHYPQCDKKMWGTSGLPIKQYDTKPRHECQQSSTNTEIKKPNFPSNYSVKNGEIIRENQPKSFKFDISHVREVEFNQQPFTPDSFGGCFFKICGTKIFYHSDNPKSFPEIFNGKEFTVEIKEKL